MKNTFFRTGSLLAALILHSCQERDTGIWMKIGGTTQGTTYQITYLVQDSIDLRREVEAVLAGFDQSLSTYIDSSLISRFNQGTEGLEPDLYLRTCFTGAEEVYRETGGAFDITVAPIVNAWGFGFTDRAEVDSLLIDSLLEFVGMDKVRIRGNILEKDMKGVMLDMNAIAQGYSVDVVANFLESKGISHYLVEIGGELTAEGHNPEGREWRVGIDKPVEGLQLAGVALQAIVKITGTSLATSGNYRRYYEKGGIKYSHTIDPSTGYPVHHSLLSATVLMDECMMADAYATAFMVMGFGKSRDFIQEHPGIQAYLIYNDDDGKYRVWYTEGMNELLIRGKEGDSNQW
jgi:thiamine biosynthesis lipoprotein